MSRTWRLSALASALVASVIGMSVVLPLFIRSGTALGATDAQTASFIVGACLAMAASSLALSLVTRMPVVTATSTAALALVSQSTGYGVADAVGALVLAALALMTTGALRPLSRLAGRIPSGISAGMLAGILVPFVTAMPDALATAPVLVGLVIITFFAVRLVHPSYALVVTLIVGICYSAATEPAMSLQWHAPTLTFIAPQFSVSAAIGLAVPIYLVTMASQNLTGLAVLRADGFSPPAGLLVGTTGAASLLTAFSGTITTGVAAITAALCTGPDAHPDHARRWTAGVFYAACYAVFALLGATLAELFLSLPASLIAAIVGLGLLSPLINALGLALADADQRMAAVVTLAVTASGVGFFGIAAAFWGLVAGLSVHWTTALATRFT